MALPSIRARLSHKLLRVSLVWGLAVTAVVWSMVRHEVDELMDNTLQESAEIIYGLLDLHAGALPLKAGPAGAMAAPSHKEHLVWQLVDAHQTVLLRSHRAPDQALLTVPAAGFADVGDQWRIFGMTFSPPAPDAPKLMLYVAQEGAERREARIEASVVVIGSAMLVGLACALWMRIWVRRELQPLDELSESVRTFDPLRPDAVLPPATRTELAPMQHAITDLGQRLAQRVASERAFTAHAAHALRTPLAGMDTQLAVALRECPPELQPRLLRSREAVGRLRRVVNALLTLFRTGSEPHWEPVQLDALLAYLPFDGLDIQAPQHLVLHADPDLLAAALLNLLDNAQRHGASRVTVTARPQGRDMWVAVRDNGSGIPPDERQRLQTAIDAQDYAALSGLGLMLADLVARAHGGGLLLRDEGEGCTVQLRLGPPPAASATL